MSLISINTLKGDPHAETFRRISLLKQAFLGAPSEFQPVIPRGIPEEVPYTEGQMVTWQHLESGILPVKFQRDIEVFIRLGCRFRCVNCSVPEHIRHAPEVLMRPEFWEKVFSIGEQDIVYQENPAWDGRGEPENAPYMRVLGGEPSTYHPSMKEEGRPAVSLGNIVDIMRITKNMPYLMAGLFSDGAALGQQPELMAQLVDVLERYHTSVDFNPKDKLPDLGSSDTSDREARASYGAYVASYFAEKKIDAVGNIVLIPPDPAKKERGNLDEVMQISRYLWARGVTTTYCPIIWRSHRAQHGRPEEEYSTQLQLTHSPQLKRVVEELVDAQISGEGKIRNSRAYIEGIPYAGVDQLIGWHTVPQTISISPNGRMGYDPVFKTLQEAFHSPGGYYGYEDHQGRWEDFRGNDYIPALEVELAKWEGIVANNESVATRVDPVAMVDTIKKAITFWGDNHKVLAPSNEGRGAWWGNTIKNTKVGKYKGVYRKDITA